MKTSLILLSLILCLPLAAQTNTAPSTSDWADSIKRVIDMNPDAINSTNWTVAIAPSYAPDMKDENGQLKEWGATAALLYPLSKFAYAGARVDYIAGDFFMPSLGVELKADIQLFGKLNVTPFAVTGVSYPVSGTDDDAEELGAIYGAGVKVHLFDAKGVRVGGFVEWERWTQFPDVDVFHAGVSASFSF